MNLQLVLLFHADNAIITHLLSQTITEHAKLLDEGCGRNDPLTNTRDKLYK